MEATGGREGGPAHAWAHYPSAAGTNNDMHGHHPTIVGDLTASQLGELELARQRAVRAAAGRRQQLVAQRRAKGATAAHSAAAREAEASHDKRSSRKTAAGVAAVTAAAVALQSEDDESDEDHTDDDDHEEQVIDAAGNPIKDVRKLKRLLRNRVSAQQARERKKQHVSTLEDQVHMAYARIATLEHALTEAQAQAESLRCIVRTLQGMPVTSPTGDQEGTGDANAKPARTGRAGTGSRRRPAEPAPVAPMMAFNAAAGGGGQSSRVWPQATEEATARKLMQAPSALAMAPTHANHKRRAVENVSASPAMPSAFLPHSGRAPHASMPHQQYGLVPLAPHQLAHYTAPPRMQPPNVPSAPLNTTRSSFAQPNTARTGTGPGQAAAAPLTPQEFNLAPTSALLQSHGRASPRLPFAALIQGSRCSSPIQLAGRMSSLEDLAQYGGFSEIDRLLFGDGLGGCGDGGADVDDMSVVPQAPRLVPMMQGLQPMRSNLGSDTASLNLAALSSV